MMDLQRVNEFMSRVEESEKVNLPHGKRLKTGLDLGTAYIVLDEDNNPVVMYIEDDLEYAIAAQYFSTLLSKN